MNTLSDAELNRLVAEKVAGWTRMGMYSHIASGKQLLGSHDVLHGTPPRDRDKPEDEQAYEPVPPYATSADAVLPLLGYWYDVEGDFDPATGEAYLTLGFFDNSKPDSVEQYFSVTSTTFARAACLALLKAAGVEVQA